MTVALSILMGVALLAPFTYLAFRKIPEYRGHGNPEPYAQNIEREHEFIVKVHPTKWRPIFFESWLTPHFSIVVENRGTAIDLGQVEARFGLYPDDPAMWGSYPIDKTRDFEVDNGGMFEAFQPGDILHFTANLDSSKIEAGKRYFIGARIYKFIPRETPGIYTPEPLLTYRIGNVIKVHPLTTLLWIGSLYLGLLGILATAITR
ncbi:hypothetical protein MYX64_07310 [Nitrospinae bacterium AH_259_B05_G02_I21]|nr:hypothetical protein [Nitrospinae bacterium AH_259_B05_G02_I21]MDA2931839.1 hypothetical protein [Nitrospinae bacterium AH-259-F20]